MSRPEKHLIIIAGANGVGKTTLAKEYLKKYKIDFLNADEIALKTMSRIKAGKHFIRKLQDILHANKSIAVESTLSGRYLLKIIKNIKKKTYRISIIYFFVDNPNIALNRIKARVDAGGHDVPKADVIRRFYRSGDNFWRLYKNVADEWAIYYNGTEKPGLTASGEKRVFEITDKSLFDLFKKVKNDK